MFIVFYNDFTDYLEYCNVITYADDTLNLISGKNVSNIETKVNMDLEKIPAYFHLSELVRKETAKVMVFDLS